VVTDETTRERVTELIRDGRICMLTTMTSDGRHVSRPMALQEAEFDGDLWFFAFSDSAKMAQIIRHPQVNVAFTTSRNAWVSVSGTAEAVDDRAKAAQLWTPFLKAWFPDGLDTPTLTLIRVRAESAEYWDAPHGRVVTLLQYGTAALLHKRPPEGDNATVEFGGNRPGAGAGATTA
jgi:general stress protein 26